jgi:hypothetical protein
VRLEQRVGLVEHQQHAAAVGRVEQLLEMLLRLADVVAGRRRGGPELVEEAMNVRIAHHGAGACVERLSPAFQPHGRASAHDRVREPHPAHAFTRQRDDESRASRTGPPGPDGAPTIAPDEGGSDGGDATNTRARASQRGPEHAAQAVESAPPRRAQAKLLTAVAGNRAIARMLDDDPLVVAESSRAEAEATRAAAKVLGAVGADDLAAKVDHDDAYGHWWVEVGTLSSDRARWTPTKSYGWWPSKSVNIAETLKITTVPGQLNKGQANDPHQGDRAEEEFHPVMEVDDTDDYATVRNKLETDIASFATGFSGSWNWRLGWGKNCHTFQDRMKKQLHLHYQKSKQWSQDPLADAKQQAASDAQAKADLLEQWRPMKDIGDALTISLSTFNPDPMVTLDEMLALTDEQKQWILDYISCSRETMNYWCAYNWMARGDSIF